jgi:hypothetical protein
MSGISATTSGYRLFPVLGFTLAALATACVVAFVGYGVQAVIAVIFVIVLAYVALVHPLKLVAFLLLTGSVSFGFVTGDQKVFFQGLGGLDVNGARLLGVILTFAILLMYKPEGRKRFFTLKPYLLFLLVAAVGLLYTWNFNSGIRLFSKFLYPYMIFCVILTEVQDRETLERLVRVVFWAIVVAFISIPVSMSVGGLEMMQETVLLGGGAGHRNLFAFYMVCVTVFSACMYVSFRGAKFALLTLLGSTAIVLSVTRIAIAALAVAMAAVFFRKSLLKGIVLMALLAWAVSSYEPITRRMFYQGSDLELTDLIGNPRLFFTNVNATGRFTAWGAGINGMFLKSPLMGMGIGSSTGIEYEAGNYLTVMHSELVRMLAEMGLVGFLLYTFAYFSLIRTATRRSSRPPSQLTSALALTIPAVVLGYFVICLTDNAFDYYTMLGQNIFAFAAFAIKSRELDEQG